MATIPVQQIDFSLLDTVVGLAAGLISTALTFLGIGWFLFKYKFIHFGQARLEVTPANEMAKGIFCVENCPQHTAEHERSMDNKEKIEALFAKINELKAKIYEVKTDLAVLKSGQEQVIRILTKGEK